MKNVLIFGGTGFIGLSLSDHLHSKGYTPILLGRNIPKESLKYKFLKWDAMTVGDWSEFLNDAIAVVNLAGKTVDCIKTPENCDVILTSRVESTRTIGQAFKKAESPPKIWIQMSTAHIYGDPPTAICTEDSSFGYGLAPTVGQAWEKAFDESKPKEVRGVVLRTSFVIGKNGGALSSLKRIVKLGLGGTAGHGKQGMSWIHEHDMNEIIYQSIIDDSFEGVYISSAPNPVSNKIFMHALRKELRVPIGLAAPEFAIRFGSKYLFRTDPELVLYGRYVKPARLEERGFNFKYPELEGALKDLLNSKKFQNHQEL